MEGDSIMLIEVPYNRILAVEYAKTWALKRNPAYYNFQGLGGDCTNFAPQCLFAGSNVMNYTPVLGWYYSGSKDRSASWSGVEYLFNFLTTNQNVGPYAVETDISNLEAGDLVQLGNSESHFYHTPVVVETGPLYIFVAAHTLDSYMRPLSTYLYDNLRCLHISGVRKYQ